MLSSFFTTSPAPTSFDEVRAVQRAETERKAAARTKAVEGMFASPLAPYYHFVAHMGLTRLLGSGAVIGAVSASFSMILLTLWLFLAPSESALYFMVPLLTLAALPLIGLYAGFRFHKKLLRTKTQQARQLANFPVSDEVFLEVYNSLWFFQRTPARLHEALQARLLTDYDKSNSLLL